MGRQDMDSDATGLAGAELLHRYVAERSRVDDAYRMIGELDGGRHAPAQARAVAHDLTVALREATVTVTRALQTLDIPTQATHRRFRPRRKATRSVTPEVAAWAAELVRLSQIGAWLRRATLDDLGVHVPTTVRVANYAAESPHIPGLGFGSPAVSDGRGPRIGIDLPSVIDGPDARQRSVLANPVTGSVSVVPKAA